MHLKVHSHFTLQGGTASIDALVDRAKADGHESVAITDRNALYGAVALTRACRKAGIRPIIGLTLNVQSPVNSRVLGSAEIVLLARNPAGYRNLCRLSSHIQATPERDQRYDAGIPWELLEAHTNGLIAIDGGRLGWLMRHLANDCLLYTSPSPRDS